VLANVSAHVKAREASQYWFGKFVIHTGCFPERWTMTLRTQNLVERENQHLGELVYALALRESGVSGAHSLSASNLSGVP